MALYDAFISYSHAKDKPLAAALQSVIQKLGKPWYRRRALRLFRDDTSLSATPHLWPTIEKSLGESRFLILLASPEAAASIWVTKEVAWWLEHKSVDTLLIAVTDGELAWDNALGDFAPSAQIPLPSVLAARFPVEPKWVDLRAYREGADPRNADFTSLAADFAAAIHGTPKEDLLSQEVRQQKRALTLAWSAAGTLAVLIAIAGWQWFEADRAKRAAQAAEKVATEQKEIAQAQRDRAEKTLNAASQTANDVVYKLAAEFRNRAGMPIDLVRIVLDRALELQHQLAERGETTRQLRQSEGAALNEVAITLQDMGDLKTALEYAQRALAIVEKAKAEDPNNPEILVVREDIGVGNETIGNILRQMRRLDEAEAAYRRSLAIYEDLAREQPDKEKWQAHLADAWLLIGLASAGEAKNQEALDAFRKSLALWQKITVSANAPVEWRRRLAIVYRQIAHQLESLGQRSQAVEAMRSNIAVIEQLAAANPDNGAVQYELALSFQSLADMLIIGGQRDQALDAFRKALAIFEKISRIDPANKRMKSALASCYRSMARALESSNRNQSIEYYQKAVELGEALTASDASNLFWQQELASTYSNLADVFWDGDEADKALQTYQKGLAVDEKLVAANAENSVFRGRLARDHYQIGNVLLGMKRYEEARQELLKSLEIAERLTAEKPNDLEALNALSSAYAKLSDLLGDTGPKEEALDYAEKTLAIEQRMVDVDPNSISWLRNLTYGYYRLGLKLRSVGRYDEALEKYRAGISTAEKVSAMDPKSPLYERDITVGYRLLASALVALGRREEAADFMRKAIEIRERLAAADPGNRRWAEDLAGVYYDLGTNFLAQDRREEANAVFRKMFDLTLRWAVSNARDATRRTNLADAVYWITQTGDDLDSALASIAKAAAKTAADGKLGGDDNEWMQIVKRAVATEYRNHARDDLYEGRFELAAAKLLAALKCDPEDAYTVLWLHIARVRAGASNADEIAATAAKVDHGQWPWPVVALYLGQSDPDATLKAATSVADAGTRNEQVCEADFYVGAYLADKGQRAEARKLLEEAVVKCPKHFIEAMDAPRELKRLATLAQVETRP